jgi:probable F420-dependent oxidoreductase
MDHVSLVLMVKPMRTMIETVRAAEAAGFEAVWTQDFKDKNAFVRLAAVACNTERIGLGTAIAYAFARSPLLDVTAALDLDELSGGRMILGLGSGTKRMNESWYGMPFAQPAPRMREAVRLIRAAIAAHDRPRFTFEGRFYQIDIVPYGRPYAARGALPILVAGVNRGMIGVAGEVSDGLVGHPLFTPRYVREVVRPALAEAARRAGRAAPAPHYGYLITSIARDRAEARREAKHQIAFYSTVRTYDAILDLHRWGAQKEAIRAAFRRLDTAAMADAVSEDMVEEIAIAGTPDECRAQLARRDGLVDVALLYSPTFGIPEDRVIENHRLIIETFGRSARAAGPPG